MLGMVLQVFLPGRSLRVPLPDSQGHLDLGRSWVLAAGEVIANRVRAGGGSRRRAGQEAAVTGICGGDWRVFQ